MLEEPQYTNEVTVQLIDAAVSDRKVIQTARVSTDGAKSIDTSESQGLINYLMRNRHGSPFEHGMFNFLISAPIFVAREHMRHRAGWSYNEESGRYKQMEPLFYIPGNARKLVQVGKTGAYDFVDGTDKQMREVQGNLIDLAEDAWETYQYLLHIGIAKEVARMVLPLNTMTTYFATCNPRSLMHFLSLRTENENAAHKSKPMAEIAMVAEQMEMVFGAMMPRTYSAYCEFGRVCP